jgi:hypothetical protein
MDKEVSIVLSKESSNYRKLAQTWYGLTDEQMKDCDVHHNPRRSEGGRNIPEHLFVYHNTLHSAVHESEFVIWCREAGKKGGLRAHEERDEFGRSLHSRKINEGLHQEKDEFGRSLHSLMMNEAKHKEKDKSGKSTEAVRIGKLAHKEKDEFGRSIHGVKTAESIHSERDEFGRSLHAIRTHSKKDGLGRSVNAVEAGKVSNSQKWEDPDHPELGVTTCGALASKQKARGLPHGPKNRRKV